MKLLHTSDWHIGKRYGQISRLSEQRGALDEICRIAEEENVDAVLVAGDIYDSFNPPTEAAELFYRTLRRLSRGGSTAVIVIAGNHDSPDKIEVSDPLALELGIVLAGTPGAAIRPFETEPGIRLLRAGEGFVELALPRCDSPLRVILAPYANELRLRKFLGMNGNPADELGSHLAGAWGEIADKYCDESGVNVLVSHLFMMRQGGERPEESDEERSISLGGADLLFTSIIPPGVQYAALGHIHKPWMVDRENCPVVYSGSPVAYGLNEAGQDKFVYIAEIEPGGKAAIERRQIFSGRRIIKGRFGNYAKAVEWLAANREAIVELTFETDTYITSEMKNGFDEAYGAPVTIIPVINSADEEEDTDERSISGKSMEELFIDYFEMKKGLKPNDELLGLFREIMAVEVEK